MPGRSLIAPPLSVLREHRNEGRAKRATGDDGIDQVRNNICLIIGIGKPGGTEVIGKDKGTEQAKNAAEEKSTRIQKRSPRHFGTLNHARVLRWFGGQLRCKRMGLLILLILPIVVLIWPVGRR